MQVAYRPEAERSGKAGGARRAAPAYIAAAAAFATWFCAGTAEAQRMSPAQEMTRSAGVAQGQRVEPMSGMSRAGLADQMGRAGAMQRPTASRRGQMQAGAAEMGGARQDQRGSVTPASASRAGSPNVNAISEYNRVEGALLVSGRSGIREISQLRGTTICFPNPADQAEASNFLGGRSVSFTALTSDGPPGFLVQAFNRGECQAIYMSRQTQQMMANMSVPDAIVLTR